jgi:hypothetical protein
MQKLWYVFFVFAQVLGANFLYAQAPVPTTSVVNTDFAALNTFDIEPSTKEPIVVGQMIEFNIPLEKIVELFPVDEAQSFDQIGIDINSSEKSKGVLIPLHVGKIQVPALIAYEAGTKTAIARSNPFTIDAQSAKGLAGSTGANKKAPELFGPLSLGLPVTAIILLTLLILLGLGGIFSYFYRRSKANRIKAVIAATPLTEDQEALRSLEIIDAKNLVSERKFKLLYHSVSDVLKKYLARRYQIDAEEATTRELLEELMRTEMEKTTQIQFKEMFVLLDVVKFTDQAPITQDAQRLTQDARKLVMLTKRKYMGTTENAI